MNRLPLSLVSLAAVLAGTAPVTASAQSIAYGDVSHGGDRTSGGDGYNNEGDGDNRRGRGRRTTSSTGIE